MYSPDSLERLNDKEVQRYLQSIESVQCLKCTGSGSVDDPVHVQSRSFEHMVLDYDIWKINVLFRSGRFNLDHVPFPVTESLEDVHPYSHTIMDKPRFIDCGDSQILYGLQCALNSLPVVKVVFFYGNPQDTAWLLTFPPRARYRKPPAERVILLMPNHDYSTDATAEADIAALPGNDFWRVWVLSLQSSQICSGFKLNKEFLTDFPHLTNIWFLFILIKFGVYFPGEIEHPILV